jgi:hypothetical protein
MKKQVIEYKMRVSIFSTTVVETFPILRRIQPDPIITCMLVFL